MVSCVHPSSRWMYVAILVVLLAGFNGTALCGEGSPASRPISTVLRQPLPPEELNVVENDGEYVVSGPTFAYHVKKATGAIGEFRVTREGRDVLKSTGPADLRIDRYRLSSEQNAAKTSIVSQGKDKVVIQVEGSLRDSEKASPEQRGPDVSCTVVHTFYNDGVVVSAVTLKPGADFSVKDAIAYELPAQGEFAHYLHKRRDEDGSSAARGRLPEAGKAVRISGLTSCLQVFSPTAALAVFTDGGAIHLSQPKLDAAVVEVTGKEGEAIRTTLTQYIAHVAPDDSPFVLKAGEAFTFRTGFCVAPNRLPHPRVHDLRMFTWIGDAKFPYPTNEEIDRVAQLGFTLFQTHRAGTAGEPRPPAGEIDRVVGKVHEAGMLFLWEENPDLLYASAPGVQKLMAENKWTLWQGFNYGGHYKAKMDPYCDLVATCLAAPNGQDEYRLANIRRMMASLPVDGLFLDDNLPYGNCKLWKEHGHPRPVYDCLIELHDMNWRRRELMRSQCPHLVLVSHNTRGFILPTVCDFDAQVYGEGYSFGSMEDYWQEMVAVAHCLYAQPMIWPGDDEDSRCPVSLAYNYDLITGGGQYTQIDWRLFSEKLPYAKGVTPRETVLARDYNLAQYYFGLYESKRHALADASKLMKTTAAKTYATLYHNQVWNDWLIAVANMNHAPQDTSFDFPSPEALGIVSGKDYAVFDVQQRIVDTFSSCELNQVKSLAGATIPGDSLRLYYLREMPRHALYHLWGGKRLAEAWDGGAKRLTLTVQGPAGAQDEVFIGGVMSDKLQFLVGGQPSPFTVDADQQVARAKVTFMAEPLTIEVAEQDK